MALARTLALVFGVWGALFAIGYLFDAAPAPTHQTGTAADYTGDNADTDSPDLPEESPSTMGYRTATAADYGGMSTMAARTGARTGTAADYGGSRGSTMTATAADYHFPEEESDPDRPYGTAYSGTWNEPTVCETLADISDLQGATDKRDALVALAERRYPPGAEFIRDMPQDALDVFVQGDDFDAWANSFDVAVHEGSHMWSARHIRFRGRSPSFVYRMTLEREHTIRRLTTMTRDHIVPFLDGPSDDSYREIYLAGESGAQGFETLLDEVNAYVHSVAASTCIRDLYGRGSRRSARDGILAMLVYLGTYLQVLERDEAEQYARLKGNEGYVDFVRDLSERAKFWLHKARDFPRLGIRDDAYLAELERGGRQDAIARFATQEP